MEGKERRRKNIYPDVLVLVFGFHEDGGLYGWWLLGCLVCEIVSSLSVERTDGRMGWDELFLLFIFLSWYALPREG